MKTTVADERYALRAGPWFAPATEAAAAGRRCPRMFAKKKKKPIISAPSNFEHRVHTGFDRREGRFVGLPPQWASLIGSGQDRPKPIVDPSHITPTEILDMKLHVRTPLLSNFFVLSEIGRASSASASCGAGCYSNR